MNKIRKMNMLSAIVLVFFIYAGVAFADTITGLAVDTNGKVGIGTSTPQSLLNLEFNAANWDAMKASGILLKNTNTTYTQSARIYFSWWALNILAFDIDNTCIMYLEADGDGYLDGNLIQTSDMSLKENIVKVDGALEKVSLLRGVTYNWTDRKMKGDKWSSSFRKRFLGTEMVKKESLIPVSSPR
jgi:hypothetical protein